MNKIGIFFGSDTGNTENIANIIYKELGEDQADIFDIAKISKEDFEKYDKLLLGISTWYYGEPQCDWNDFFPVLDNIKFFDKTVAIFGCGDQEDYSEYFCDAMGILYKIVKSKGASIIGYWSTENYYFDASQALIDKNNFVGLAIDEDRQPNMTITRIKNWLNKIKKQINK